MMAVKFFRHNSRKPKGSVLKNTLRQAYATPYDMRGFASPKFHGQLNFEPVDQCPNSDIGMVYGRGGVYPQGRPHDLSHVFDHHAHQQRAKTLRVVSSSVRQGTKTMMQAASVRPSAPTANHGHPFPTHRDTPAHAGNHFNRDVIAVGNAENAIARVLFELRKPQPDNARALKLAQAAMAAVQYVGVEVLQ